MGEDLSYSDVLLHLTSELKSNFISQETDINMKTDVEVMDHGLQYRRGYHHDLSPLPSGVYKSHYIS